MWGVSPRRTRQGEEYIEHVEFDVRVESGEEHIIRRLNREKRVGRVEKIDGNTYRFYADVYDTMEMIPWIRTFICRIVRLNFSNKAAEQRFKEDLEVMYSVYGIAGGDEK